MIKAWDEKKSKQVKITSIFLVCMAVLFLLMAFLYSAQAIKMKSCRGYSWGEVIELTQINDKNIVYSKEIYFIEISARKVLSSFMLSIMCFTGGFLLNRLRKTHGFYQKEIEAIKRQNAT